MIIVKVGGGEGLDIKSVVADVAELVKQGQQVVLVHGGSHETNVISEKLGHPPRFVTSVSGHQSRYTDRETLEIFVMVTAGKINKLIVEQLQQLGVNAVGLSGIDGRLLEGKRKVVPAHHRGRQAQDPARRVQRHDREGQRVAADHAAGRGLHARDRAATPSATRARRSTWTATGLRPPSRRRWTRRRCSSSPTCRVCCAMSTTKSSLITQIPQSQAEDYLDRYAKGRMKRKVLGAVEAMRDGAGQVIIADGRVDQPVQRRWRAMGRW